MDSSDRPAWRELEARIGSFFAENGYATELNVVREGRSGGRHEIDVLAIKSDGITDLEVMVECKAWNSPIEKDIVSKADYVVRDLGLNKAIIVSLAGWRSGAETAARELGIDLWDASDLERRIGAIETARLVESTGVGARVGQRHVVGPSPTLSEDEAARLLNGKRSGVIGKEELVWHQLAWLPFFVVGMQHSYADRRLFRGERVRSLAVTNVFDGLDGHFYVAHEARDFEQHAADVVISSRVRERQIKTAIEKTCARLSELSSPSARERQAEKIKALGVPLPFTRVEVSSVTPIAWPYYIGLMRRREAERLVAVDAARAMASDRITRLCTEHHGYVSGHITST